MSSSQSEERTIVFTGEKKMIRSIRIANDVFSRVRKMIRPIRSHRGVWVSRQNSSLLWALAACSAASQTFNETSFSRGVFLVKKIEKHLRNWSGIVSNSGRGKRDRVVSLSCAFYRSDFVFFLSLSLYSNQPFYLNSFIFNCTFRKNN